MEYAQYDWKDTPCICLSFSPILKILSFRYRRCNRISFIEGGAVLTTVGPEFIWCWL